MLPSTLTIGPSSEVTVNLFFDNLINKQDHYRKTYVSTGDSQGEAQVVVYSHRCLTRFQRNLWTANQVQPKKLSQIKNLEDKYPWETSLDNKFIGTNQRKGQAKEERKIFYNKEVFLY